MWVTLLTVIPAIIAAVGGIVVALNGRREAKAKAALSPIELTDRALKVADEWITKLARELKETEEECDRRIRELQSEVGELREQVRLYTDPRRM